MTLTRMRLRDRILTKFEAATANSLVEFGKNVASIRTDYTICMARKAARLLDLLVLAGGPSPPRPTLFHHVLDQDRSKFKGRTVTLIDDTLILGTTLGKAERELRAAGVKDVESIVFVTDKDHWDDRLVSPTKTFQSLNHQDLLTFCAAEVNALAAFSIPYLSDFPFLKEMRLSRAQIDLLQSLHGWEAASLTSAAHTAERGITFSAIPDDGGQQVLARCFGDDAANLVKLCKIRAYARRSNNGIYWTKIVPIATFAPLTEVSVEQLFERLVRAMEIASDVSMSRLRSDLSSTTSKLRFAQYIVSAAIGRDYCRSASRVMSHGGEITFSTDEAVHLFGPWLRREIVICHRVVESMIDVWAGDGARSQPLRKAALPAPVVMLQSDCAEFVVGPGDTLDTVSNARTLQTDLERIFLRLHQRHELAAREEVKRFGSKIFDVEADEAPHRNRLSVGFEWQTVADCVLRREGLRATPMRVARLSFVLDSLVDTGVAVPFLTSKDGIFFRAYRHGEDVVFANQEFALAYDSVHGFLEGSGRSVVPRVELEKLLVTLLRVGIAKRFLQPVHGLNGATSGVARIGFHLHGAVATFPTNDNLFADDRESWLSRFLVSDGVLEQQDDGYRLGMRPEAAHLTGSASAESQQLGHLIGLLSAEKNETGKAILSRNDLIILASCAQPRDAALALAAELKIIVEGFRRLPRSLATSSKAARSQVKDIVHLPLYVAMNSARMKAVCYRNGIAEEVVSRCERHLKSTPNGTFLARHWRGIWDPILIAKHADQRRRFDPWIDDCVSKIAMFAEGILALEAAAASVAAATGNAADRSQFGNTCRKMAEFIEDMSNLGISSPLQRRLNGIAQTRQPIADPKVAFDFGLKRVRDAEEEARSLVRQVVSVARDYGRTDERINYDYAVWYDVIDSTGQRSGLSGDALRAYRNRVRSFKSAMIVELQSLTIEASRRSTQVYCWANAIESKDDEKNVFLTGGRSHEFVKRVVGVLVNTARAHRVAVRAMAVDTRFAGEAAHKYASSINVEGEAFWEHGSRLKQQLKGLEDKGARGLCYLWLCGDIARRPERHIDIEPWLTGSGRGALDTTIENFPLTTQYVGGSINTEWH